MNQTREGGKEWERNNEKISKKILIISQSPPLQFFSRSLFVPKYIDIDTNYKLRI